MFDIIKVFHTKYEIILMKSFLLYIESSRNP